MYLDCSDKSIMNEESDAAVILVSWNTKLKKVLINISVAARERCRYVENVPT